MPYYLLNKPPKKFKVMLRASSVILNRMNELPKESVNHDSDVSSTSSFLKLFGLHEVFKVHRLGFN